MVDMRLTVGATEIGMQERNRYVDNSLSRDDINMLTAPVRYVFKAGRCSASGRGLVTTLSMAGWKT
jgi:hypothetical protein